MQSIQKKWLFRAIGQYSVVTISETQLIRETYHEGQKPIISQYEIESIYPSVDAQNGTIITASPDFPNQFNAFPWFAQSENTLSIQWDNFQFENQEAAKTPPQANATHAAKFEVYHEENAQPITALSDTLLNETFLALADLVKNEDSRIVEKPPVNQDEFRTMLTKGFMLVLGEKGYDRNTALQTFKVTFQAKQSHFLEFAEKLRSSL